MRIEEEVIDATSEEGARVVALALLGEADGAADRYAKAADDEALHDFRVALRRLRSTLRAFRPWLEDSVGRRLERRLKKRARATNAARDAEVQLAWLASKREALPTRRQRLGLDMLVERYEARRRGAPDPVRAVDRYRGVAEKLHRRLATYQRRVDAAGVAQRTTFGGVLATLLGDHLDALRERLDAVQGASDQAGVHQARIEGKRLRYLLEPLRGNRHADAAEAVKQLKRLQDVLGDLHDSHVLAQEVGEALVDAAAERARQLFAAVNEERASGAALRDELRGSPRAGLLAVLRLVCERRDALYADLEREWRVGAFDPLAAEVQGLAGALEARAGGKLERERRYVLAAVPPRAADLEPVETEQGWLPGARVRERIRHVSGPSGDRYWRGLKQGAGRVRLESEEETTREVFEALWQLTEGRRVAKRRRVVEDGKLSWRIDEFTDRSLILAQVELPAGAADAPLADWLRPLVIREVTDDPAYLDENLAAAPAPVVPAEAIPTPAPAPAATLSGEPAAAPH